MDSKLVRQGENLRVTVSHLERTDLSEDLAVVFRPLLILLFNYPSSSGFFLDGSSREACLF